MRRLATFVLVALLAPACGGGSGPPPSATATVSPTGSPTERWSPTPPGSLTPSASPTPMAMIQLPADAPTKLATSLASDDLPVQALVPPGAQVTTVWRLSPTAGQVPQIALAWTRGADPFAAEHGFEMWQRFPNRPRWRVVYAFTDRPAAGVLGIRFDIGDLTGDDVADTLTFEDMGGSGGCGVWRVVESGQGGAAEIFRRKTCDTEVQIAGGALRIRAAVYLPGDSHCCPSKYRTTTLRWDGTTWKVVEQTVTAA